MLRHLEENIYSDASNRSLLPKSGGSQPNYSGDRSRILRPAPLYFQPGRGFGNFFVRLLRFVRPPVWSGAKAVAREALRTRGKIITDIGKRKPADRGYSV